jgi:tetratricopeptide (TPR) repeat protein
MVVIEEVFEESTALQFKLRGNAEFQAGNFKEAIDVYTLGIEQCGEAEKNLRAVLLTNRGFAQYRLSHVEECIADCTEAVTTDPSYTKAYYRRALAYEKTEEFEQAVCDLDKCFELDAAMRVAEKMRYQTLLVCRDKKFEKQKSEMLNSLKDIGNSILGQFGLSTEDFKVNKDPVTGSYSLSMNRAAPTNGS